MESDQDKIIGDSFDLEKYSPGFISDTIDLFLNKNLTTEELNKSLHKRFILFVGEVFNDVKKVYSTDGNGALYYFSANICDFIEKKFSDLAIDNLMEINDGLFEEMVSNAVDLYEQMIKNEASRLVVNSQSTSNQQEKVVNKDFFIRDIFIFYTDFKKTRDFLKFYI